MSLRDMANQTLNGAVEAMRRRQSQHLGRTEVQRGDPKGGDAVAIGGLERDAVIAERGAGVGGSGSSLDNLRPASRAHLALEAAVLQCLESDVYPETIVRFVHEALAGVGRAVPTQRQPESGSGGEGAWQRFVSRDGRQEVEAFNYRDQFPLALLDDGAKVRSAGDGDGACVVVWEGGEVRLPRTAYLIRFDGDYYAQHHDDFHEQFEPASPPTDFGPREGRSGGAACTSPASCSTPKGGARLAESAPTPTEGAEVEQRRTWRIETAEGDEGFVIGPEFDGEVEVMPVTDHQAKLAEKDRELSAERDRIRYLDNELDKRYEEIERLKARADELKRYRDMMGENAESQRRRAEKAEQERDQWEREHAEMERERNDWQALAEQNNRIHRATVERTSKLEGLVEEAVGEFEDARQFAHSEAQRLVAPRRQPARSFQEGRVHAFRYAIHKLNLDRLQAQHSPEEGGEEEGVCPECDHDIRPGASHARTCSRNPLTRGETVEAHYGTGSKTAPVPLASIAQELEDKAVHCIGSRTANHHDGLLAAATHIRREWLGWCDGSGRHLRPPPEGSIVARSEDCGGCPECKDSPEGAKSEISRVLDEQRDEDPVSGVDGDRAALYGASATDTPSQPEGLSVSDQFPAQPEGGLLPRRWKIWRIERGEGAEVWTGAEGPATNPPPDDPSLVGESWINAATVDVVEFRPQADVIEAVGDVLQGIVTLEDDDERPAPREHYIDLARNVLAAQAAAPSIAAKAVEERDKWAIIGGIGMDIARAAQMLLATVRPADGMSDPATVSRKAITDLQDALRAAEPEQGTPLDEARRQAVQQARERLLAELEKARQGHVGQVRRRPEEDRRA